jgi:hypothetical protein
LRRLIELSFFIDLSLRHAEGFIIWLLFHLLHGLKNLGLSLFEFAGFELASIDLLLRLLVRSVRVPLAFFDELVVVFIVQLAALIFKLAL